MTCMSRECDGCMRCQEPNVVLKSDDGEPIYEGEEYFDIDGVIITPDELKQYRKVAGG